MNKTTRRIAIAALLGAGLVITLNSFQNVGGRFSLERYKTELRAKGEKLTFKELAITPSTNEEHIAALQTLSLYTSSQGPLVSGIFPRTIGYITPGKARVAWRGDLQLDNGVTPTTADWDALDRQNNSVTSPLAQIRQALLNSPPDSGWAYDDVFSNAVAGPPRTFSRDRIIAQSLQRDAIGELHHGNLGGALDDLHALVGQVHMNRNELTLVSQMIRVAIAGLSLSTTWEALQAPGWDEARLAALQEDWERTDFMCSLERSFEGGRAHNAIIMAEIRRSGVNPIRNQFKGGPPLAVTGNSINAWFKAFWSEDLPWYVYRLNGSPNEDELTQLWYSTRALELVRSLNAGRPWPEVSTGLTNLAAQLSQKLRADRLHRLRVSAFALPEYSRLVETAIHNETQRRLTITAIAIKRYELKHGQPPPDLDALSPAFLASVPKDPMSRKSLCYRLDSRGAFVLYSVGDDGKDDGGTAGMSLWSGSDAVWPAAATPEEERAIKSAITSM